MDPFERIEPDPTAHRGQAHRQLPPPELRREGPMEPDPPPASSARPQGPIGEALMAPLLHWSEVDDPSWPPHYTAWRCYCDADVSLVWSSSCSLLDTDDTIEARDRNADSWRLECHQGHVLLVCHELSEDESADTYPAPTTREIVERLGLPEDVARWRASWREPQVEPAEVPAPRVVDLMAALEDSLAAAKSPKDRP